MALHEEEYKSIKINERNAYFGDSTYFEVQLSAHSDSRVKKVNIYAPSLEECRIMVDERLTELEKEKR